MNRDPIVEEVHQTRQKLNIIEAIELLFLVVREV